MNNRKDRPKRPDSLKLPDARLSTTVKAPRERSFHSTGNLNSILTCTSGDLFSGRYRIKLYRFLADNLPAINSCLSTWVRLSAAPGQFEIDRAPNDETARLARSRLERLSNKIYMSPSGHDGSIVTLLVELFGQLYRDGLFGGFLTVHSDGSGVDRFVPIDSADLLLKDRRKLRLSLENQPNHLNLERPDFYFIPFNSDISHPLGRSIFQAVPFVAYIERQLTDDMRRASHNSGFHRLHVKVTPPERTAGESDNAYIDRINSYFDSTVSMIKSCDIDENPVTWDNISIEHIGPENVRSVTNSWFVNHRAMIEEICAGTNLSPYLLGYSYGTTTTWASFKFDIVMRQVKSVQAEVAAFLEWMANIDLSLAGLDVTCRFKFDNTFAYQAADRVKIESERVDNVLRLFEAGLIDEATARRKAGELI